MGVNHDHLKVVVLMQNAIKPPARNLSGRHAPFLLPISDILPPSVFILPSGSCLLQSSLLPGMKTIKAFIHFLHPPLPNHQDPPIHPPNHQSPLSCYRHKCLQEVTRSLRGQQKAKHSLLFAKNTPADEQLMNQIYMEGEHVGKYVFSISAPPGALVWGELGH